MRGVIGLVSLLAMLFCGCAPDAEWEENPSLVLSKAELAGGAVIFTYFGALPEARAGAKHLKEVVTVLEVAAKSFPADGFVSLIPGVEKTLEANMGGDAEMYLPTAKLLVSVLLNSLQQKAEQEHWFDDTDEAAVTGILAAFMKGAGDAIAAHAVPDP